VAAVPKEVDRTARGQIESVAAGLGAVLPRVVQTSRMHRSVGWYFLPAHALAGCSCEYCAAVAAERPVYIGFHRRDAIIELGRYVDNHEQLLERVA
jgi:hypothetical protein